MSLTHTDMLKISSAIDAYEKRYPRRPSPTAAEALAWQSNKGVYKIAASGMEAVASRARGLAAWLKSWTKRIPAPRRVTVLTIK